MQSVNRIFEEFALAFLGEVETDGEIAFPDRCHEPRPFCRTGVLEFRRLSAGVPA